MDSTRFPLPWRIFAAPSWPERGDRWASCKPQSDRPANNAGRASSATREPVVARSARSSIRLSTGCQGLAAGGTEGADMLAQAVRHCFVALVLQVAAITEHVGTACALLVHRSAV